MSVESKIVAEADEFDQLMAQVRAGSETAIWRLAEGYTPYILRAVRRTLPKRLRSKLDSQDFAQTLWASLLLDRDPFTRFQSRQELIAYLIRATKNKVIDKTRHFLTQKHDVSREQRLAAALPQFHDTLCASHEDVVYSRDPTPSSTAMLRERWEQVQARISEQDREILQLRLKGCTYEDICCQLHIHQATARRATQRLFTLLTK